MPTVSATATNPDTEYTLNISSGYTKCQLVNVDSTHDIKWSGKVGKSGSDRILLPGQVLEVAIAGGDGAGAGGPGGTLYFQSPIGGLVLTAILR